MYYLLENNIIVDSENLPKNAKIERIAKDDKGNAFFIQIQYLDFLKTRKIGYIKKQSENVCDLIEKEDLIKIKMCDTFSILEVKGINGGVNGMKHITSIYKQDENGNYIKVWEKKDEKEIHN